MNIPAFPQSNERVVASISISKSQGMTLRDYFAAKAMQALIDNDGLFSEIPTQSYELADAMLKEREA
jgi:hypothetical protein